MKEIRLSETDANYILGILYRELPPKFNNVSVEVKAFLDSKFLPVQKIVKESEECERLC